MMPALDELLKLGESAEQLFIWNVLGQIVGHLMQPFLQAIDNKVLPVDRNVPLSPAALAGMVVRGHISESEAGDEAGLSGVSAGRLHRMIQSYGNPPGPEALAAALRRGIIPEGAAGDESPSYRGGIAQGDLQNMWADVIKALELGLPSPTSVITAYIRSMLDETTARQLYALYGADPSGFDLEANITGEGPTPVEAGVLLNRGIIPQHGTGPNAVSFDQAVSESRFKNKWSDAYAALRSYRPPPRTITAMIHEGRLTPEEAAPLLQDYGVRDTDLNLYVGQAAHEAVQKAHTITETELIKLYTERGIDTATTTQLLKDIGYSERDAGLILSAADLDYHSKLSTATITAVRSAYLHLHLDRNGVVTRLDALGISSVYRDSLLQLWDLEIETGVKQLTVKQVLDIWGVGMISQETAELKLRQIGYSAEDARFLIQLNSPGATPTAAQFAQLSNPGG